MAMALVVEVYLVSILVLMDITLILKSYYEGNIVWKCFNPCFNGYYTYTICLYSLKFFLGIRFNPCFNGYYTYTKKFLNAVQASV